jgi:hypothetical protein
MNSILEKELTLNRHVNNSCVMKNLQLIKCCNILTSLDLSPSLNTSFLRGLILLLKNLYKGKEDEIYCAAQFASDT